MNAGRELEHYERRVARALRARDPVAAFRAAAADTELGADLSGALARAEPRGIRLAALLVARLRFERVMQGSVLAGEWFAADPAAFARAFRDYHEEVVPNGAGPRFEGAAFENWCAARGLPAS